MLRSGALVLLLGLLGCNDKQGGGAVDASPIADARPVDAATPDAHPNCHSLEQTADLIEQIAVAEDPPVPIGGEIPDGTYHMVSDTLYTGAGGATGPTGQSHRATTQCRSLECKSRGFSQFLGDLRAIVIFEPDGSDLRVTQVCPEPEVVADITFSTVVDESGTRVTLFEKDASNLTFGRTYELQP